MTRRHLVGVQFQTAGKVYSYLPGELDLSVGDSVVVESERGTSLASVVKIQFEMPSEELEYKEILRKATSRDLEVSSRLSPEEVLDYTRKKVVERELNMKVLKADVVFGGNKVIVYFTAPGRVDFRELVKDLAGGLKTRVELKQVGARDATKVVGGVGVCGRAYCCSTFLREFVPVSIRMAKNQNLALNPMKTAGACGRLLCCLTYEDDTYTYLRKQLPPLGVVVEFQMEGIKAQGKVVKSDLLNQVVMVEEKNGQTHEVKVQNIQVLDRSGVVETVQEEVEQEVQADDDWAADLDLAELEAYSNKGKAENKKARHHQNRNRRPQKEKSSNEQNENRPRGPRRNHKQRPNKESSNRNHRPQRKKNPNSPKNDA